MMPKLSVVVIVQTRCHLRSSDDLHENNKRISTRKAIDVVLTTKPPMAKSNDKGIVVMIRALILLYVDKNEFLPLFGI